MMTLDRPALTAEHFTAIIDDLLLRWQRDGMHDPLNQRVTLWCVLQDVYDMLGATDDQLHPEVRACGDWPLPAA